MPSFEKLKRRNQDYILLETIKQIGVSNYSLLARMTGLNAETVRYKVTTQIGRYGLGVHVSVNYPELGMSTGLATIKGSSSGDRSWLDTLSYLSFVGKIMGSELYTCLMTVPFRLKKKYLDVLEAMKQRKLFEDIVFADAEWVRYPPFRSEFYNFDEKRWVVDWRRVDMTLNEVGATSGEVNRDAQIDYIDLRIVKATQETPTISLAKVAKEIGANPRTVRYHNAEHVVKNKLILSNNVRWEKPIVEGRPGDLMQAIVSFKSLKHEEITQARKLMNKIPFTWLEVGTEDGGYFAFLDVPIDRFHETIRYVEAHIEALRDRFSLQMLDAAKTRSLLIPDEMFDSRRGWSLPSYQREVVELQEEDKE